MLIDYIAKIKETGEIIDTTLKDVARENKILREDKVYRPLLVIVGEHRVVKGLEEALLSFEVGEEREVEVEPKKAYGERDRSKVKMVSLREFLKRKITPRVGDVVEIGGFPAVIRSITGGRVVVDFNHPLAGKTIVYKVKVLKKIENPKEKILALIERRVKGIDLEKVGVDLSENKVVIRLPEEVYLVEDIQYAKKAIAREIVKYVEGVKVVEFVETYAFGG